MEGKVKTVEIELRVTKLTKSLLKQMRPIETFTRDYLPGGEEAQEEGYKLLGWVHGSIIERGETYWNWLVVQLRPGDFVRLRVEKEHLLRLDIYKSGQIYVV